MDNITHSLIGVLTAEAAIALLQRKESADPVSPQFRIALWLSSVFANNFPDLDFLGVAIMHPKKLQYLVHHRGYTHSFLLAPVQGAMIALLFLVGTKLRKQTYTRKQIAGVTGIAILGVILHVLMDGLNSYGVHPLWPFDGRWFYGDSLFIVEPWIWVSLIPLLFYATENRYLRAFAGALFIAALGLLWLTGLVPPVMSAVVTLWGLVMGWRLRDLKASSRVAISTVALVFVVSLFITESHWLRKEVIESYRAEEPGVVLNDVILSPLPSNPFCWHLITVETYATRVTYRLRRGVMALMPSFYASSQCVNLLHQKSVPFDSSHRVTWTTDFKFNTSDLIGMMKKSCTARAQMKFLRAPFWRHQGSKTTLGDLRFETGTRGNFSSFEVQTETDACPDFLPNWVEPRADLLIPH